MHAAPISIAATPATGGGDSNAQAGGDDLFAGLMAALFNPAAQTVQIGPTTPRVQGEAPAPAKQSVEGKPLVSAPAGGKPPRPGPFIPQEMLAVDVEAAAADRTPDQVRAGVQAAVALADRGELAKVEPHALPDPPAKTPPAAETPKPAASPAEKPALAAPALGLDQARPAEVVAVRAQVQAKESGPVAPQPAMLVAAQTQAVGAQAVGAQAVAVQAVQAQAVQAKAPPQATVPSKVDATAEPAGDRPSPARPAKAVPQSAIAQPTRVDISTSTEAIEDAALADDGGARDEWSDEAAHADSASHGEAGAAQKAEATPAALVRGSPHTVAHLSAEIARKLEAQTTRFQVELKPAGMGAVDVKVEIGASGAITAAMTFDSAQSADAMRARADELQAALEQAGFDVSGGLSFTAGGMDHRQSGGEARSHASAGPGPAAAIVTDELPTIPAQPQRFAAAQGRLDIRI
jgi:flagellar hook-length control protein FliK